jgi:hypothetical protein
LGQTPHLEDELGIPNTNGITRLELARYPTRELLFVHKCSIGTAQINKAIMLPFWSDLRMKG